MVSTTFKTTLDVCRQTVTTFVYIIYRIMYAIVGLCNRVLSNIIVQGLAEDTAMIGHVLWRWKLNLVGTTTPGDFMCLFTSTVDLDYVLKPTVSLYAVSASEAVFVETPEHVNIYSSDENVFVMFAQFEWCIKVIKVPVRAFNRLADKVGDPKVPVTWMTNTGRCGSTILCQVLEKVPGTLVMCEPDAPQNVYFLRKANLITDEEHDKLLQSTIRLLCKPRTGVERICIKPRQICEAIMRPMSKLFPDFHHLFMYRNCRGFISGWLGIMISVPYLDTMRVCINSEMISTCTPYFRKTIEELFLCHVKGHPNVYLNIDTVGILTHMWARFMILAREAISHDPNILPLKFEDLVSDPEGTCRVIFEKIAIDTKYLKSAVLAFKKDSHRGTVVSRSRIGNDPRRNMSEADRVRADAMLARYNLPSMDEDFIL